MQDNQIREAEQKRDQGIERAAAGHAIEIAFTQLKLMQLMLQRSDGVAFLDEVSSPDELGAVHVDRSRGKWRGQVTLGLKREGIIESIGAVRSLRKCRNRGLVTQFRLVSTELAKAKIYSIQRMIAGLN